MDGSVRAWHLELASLTAAGRPVRAHQGWTRMLHYDVESDLLVSCGDDGHVKACQGKGILAVTRTGPHLNGTRLSQYPYPCEGCRSREGSRS